jgi:hypothetical protein
MLEILRKKFESNPEESIIVFKEKCSECGHESKIDVTRTSSGFGVRGGNLCKSYNDNYIVMCAVCIEANLKIAENA